MQELTTTRDTLTIEDYIAYVNSLPYDTIQSALIAASRAICESLLTNEPRETREALRAHILICQRALNAAAGL